MLALQICIFSMYMRDYGTTCHTCNTTIIVMTGSFELKYAVKLLSWNLIVTVLSILRESLLSRGTHLKNIGLSLAIFASLN